ncbi:MAG: hypothetical protein QM790_19905 [Nibricoccus sp.]
MKFDLGRLRSWFGHDGSFAHPDAPAGGGGAGFFDTPGYLGEDTITHGLPDPHSWAAMHLHWEDVAGRVAEHVLEELLSEIRASSNWDRLRLLSVHLPGPYSFGLGACYGVAKNPIVSVAQLYELQKLFIEAEIYAYSQRPKSWWSDAAFRATLMMNPAGPLHILNGLRRHTLVPADFKRAYEMRSALVDEVGQLFTAPGDFFAHVKDQLKNTYIEKWNRFKALEKQQDLKGQFEAGEVFGDVLMDVVMVILTVVTVGSAAIKIAAKVPQLARVAECIRALRTAEAGAATEEVIEARNGLQPTRARPKEGNPRGSVYPAPKTPIAAELSNIEANGVTPTQVRQGTNGRVAVIGRDMRTVRPYAETLRSKGYEVEIFDPPLVPQSALDEWQALRAKYAPQYIPDSEVVKTSLYKANQQWANKLVADGYTVTDIGSAPGSSLSPFYEMEKATIF